MLRSVLDDATHRQENAAPRPGHESLIRYTNSETCPSGKSNSNVFSVIDTIV
jgi:hypothetical protein